ncbi:adaptor protein MecA [Holzapfeliella sp. He02]|uniref:Adaptor protein MecA n=1 Tax=Holzapfeliella saturejae TaxID=3082953 RepID=A0ABU8SH83_9LACO
MEMQRINDNTIRVILGSEDLEERGITMLDLLGNQGHIEQFFRNILEEVDENHTFAQNDAVTFQIMPSNDGLELLISRTNMKKSAVSSDQSVQESQNNAQQLQELLQSLDDGSISHVDANEDKKNTSDYYRIYEFNSIEDAIELAKELPHVSGVDTKLYADSTSQTYLMSFRFDPHQSYELSIKDFWIMVNEFGDLIQGETKLLLSNAKCVLTDNAIENLKTYFD